MMISRSIFFVSLVLAAGCAAETEPAPGGHEEAPAAQPVETEVDKVCPGGDVDTNPALCICNQAYASCTHSCMAFPPGYIKTTCMNGCSTRYYTCIGG